MTWPPQGSNPDPYQQSYGQYPQADPYAQQYPPAQPYGQPTSGQPYSPGQPYSGAEYPGSPAPSGYDQGGYQQGYQQPYATYQPPKGTNTMAILALVFAFVFSPLGIVFGHMGRKQIRQSGEQGDGLALAGMIIGYVATGLYVVFCCIYAIAAIGIFSSAATTGGG
ncbi:MAG: DUF4190 domain-containing protein [Micromonosporaceae bacterium]|nr:DUF4190 domain-containing protein [Micromonosporaceae bacterium]